MNRLYLLFLFFTIMLATKEEIQAQSNYVSQPKIKTSNSNLTITFDLMSTKYKNTNTKYSIDQDTNYLFYQFNQIRIGVNPFYKIDNIYLNKLNIKFSFGVGGFNDFYFDYQNLILQYDIVTIPALTLYVGYVIISYYDFIFSSVIDKKVVINKDNSLGYGIIFGINVLLHNGYYLTLEYQNHGKYINGMFDSKGFSLGITYKIPVFK